MSSLVPDQLVDICLAGGWRRTVRVAVVDGDGVDLLPLDGPAALPAGIDAWEATIEWRAERGLARVQGVLAEAAGALRFRGADSAIVMQRRQFVRVRCGVTVTLAGAGADPILTETLDLSQGGMLIGRADALPMRIDVRFVLALGDGETFSGEGRIVRGTPFGHRAIAFKAITGSDEQRLARFIAELERRQLASAAALR
jgi:hypothetical protein